MVTDPLALTSRWMAAARAYESGRPDRLFDDPLAAALADPEGFAWLGRMEPVTRLGGPQLGPGLYCVVRTRFFDDFLLRASRSFGIRQIVLLAAGMDARAFRLRWPPGTHIFELDFPEVISIKEAVIGEAEARAGCDRHTLAVDLRQPSWPEALREASYEARELSAWVLEGFLFYVTEATVHMLLERVGALASRHSWFGADLVSRDLLASPAMWPLFGTFVSRGVPGRFGTNHPEALFAKHGWEAGVIQPGEPEANYGRWPYPVAPRAVTGIPRLFLVRARRA